MTPVLLTLLFLGVFSAGVASGASIASIRHRGTEGMKRALERARAQGRLEATRTDRPGIEPPRSWDR